MVSVVEKPAGDLAPGEIVQVAGRPAAVLDEPFLGRSGSSVFDAAELFVRARVRPFGISSGHRYVTWGVSERVVVWAPQ